MTREELRCQLWPSDTFVDFDNGLNTSIYKLREALGDSAESPRFIETLPRRGYRFIAPVEGARADPLVAPTPSPPRRLWRVVAAIGAAVSTIVAIGSVLWWHKSARVPDRS